MEIKRIYSNLDIKVGQRIKCIKTHSCWWGEVFDENKTYPIVDLYYKEVTCILPGKKQKYDKINRYLEDVSNILKNISYYCDPYNIRKHQDELIKQRENCLANLSLPCVKISTDSINYPGSYTSDNFCIITEYDLNRIKDFIFEGSGIKFLDEYFCLKKHKRNKILNELGI